MWFTRRTTWEPTANWGRGGNRIRIGVAVDGLITWAKHRKTGGIGAKTADGLELSAMAFGSNAQEWLLSYSPVPRERWVSVQRLSGRKWIEMWPVREDHQAGNSESAKKSRRETRAQD